MATKFIFSGAAGLNDGSSWVNAWTSAASSTGAAAGDIVKIHKTHSEITLGASLNYSNGTINNPVQIICVDKDNSDALATGAVIGFNTTNTGPQGNILVYGVTFSNSAANLRVIPANAGKSRFESCTFVSTSTGGVQIGSGVESRCRIEWNNCTIDYSGASNASVSLKLDSGTSVIFTWVGGAYTCRATQTNLISSSTSFNLSCEFRGVNFNGTVTNLFSGGTTASGLFRFDGCSAPTYTNVFAIVPTHYDSRVNLEGFQSGTLSAALLRPSLQADYAGTMQATTSRYRTGGADDKSQVNPQSIQITSNANANNLTTPFENPPLFERVGTGAQTITIFVASGATLNDDECWIDVMSPSEAVSPTAQGRSQSTRCAPLATPAALTTDAVSTWNGSGVGTKQKMSVSINPTVAGTVEVRVNLAKASTTIYIDPLVNIA